MDGIGREQTLTSEGVGERFRALRASAPSEFGPATDQQAEQWHRRTVAGAEAASQWFAAAFHLRLLLANGPADEDLDKRLRIAEQRHRDGPPVEEP